MIHKVKNSITVSKENYLWLAIGIALLIFANGRYAIPALAWLYPVFMIRFMRKEKPLKGYLVLAISIALASVISFWGTASPEPSLLLQLLPAFFGAIVALTFLADRILHKSFSGMVSTLIFPLAYTVFEFLFSLLNPMGSTGLLAYTQYYNLPLIQIVSVTGIWGLTFLITWFGSTINWIWDRGFLWPNVKKGVLLYGLILCLVLTYGGARLTFTELSPGTVKVAGLYAYDLRQVASYLWQLAEDDREKYRQRSLQIQEKLFESSRKEANAGSKIIVWSEISPLIAAEDEEMLMVRVKETAREDDIYLVVAPFIDHSDDHRLNENKMIIISPEGKEELTHYKFGGSSIEGSVPGDAVLQVVETDYGKLSGVVCWDQDFPHIMKQAGKLGVDIMFAPNADWKAITPMHTHIGIFRAVENGYSLVRPNVNGLSVITDPLGRVIASMDHDQSSEWVLVAQVPTKGIKTIYSIIGDLFGWLSVTIFSGLVLYKLILNRKK